MVTIRTRSLAAVAAGALLLAPLAGCGGSDSKKASDKSSASASSSAAATPGVTASGTPSDDNPDADATGEAVDADEFVTSLVTAMREKKTAHMVIDMGSSATADADVRYSASDTAMKMRMTTGGQTLEAIVVGKTIYIQQGTGSKYLKIDENTPGMGSILGQFTSLSPAQTVETMRGAIKKVVKVGDTELDGDKVTKYVVTVDTSIVKKQLGAAASGADLPPTISYTMYADSEHLLRGVKMDVGGQKIKLSVSDWGKPVDIKAPPASKVTTQP